jgi:outer membrane protein assembly factor BamB
MNPVTETTPAEATAPPMSAVIQGPPRLWPAILMVLLFWAGSFVMGAIEKPYFVQFLYNMAAPAVLLIVFSIWWWRNRRIPWADRVYGCLLVVGTGAAVAPLCHRTILIGLLMLGLPVALTVVTLWMLFMQWTGFAWKRTGLLVALALVWGYFPLIRIDGLNADLQSATKWRWTPTAEEEFLAEKAQAANAATPARDVAPITALAAGDWPCFRGSNRDGVIPGVTIAADWNTNPPKLLWRHRVGPAWSSVIVVGDRLFTQEQRGEMETVVCYEASTGREVWVHGDRARFTETVSGAGPRATPTFAGGRLFTQGATGIVNCLDAATGQCIWSHDVTADAPAKPPMWGYASSPLVVDDKVIVFAGGEGDRNLLSFRIDTGALAWTAPASHDSYASPELVTLAGERQCLLLGDHGLTSVDPATGKVFWQFGWVQPGAPRILQAHVLGSSRLVAGTLSGPGVACVEVTRDGDQWKVAEIWSTTEMSPEFPDFVVHEGHAYGFTGAIFCCLDLATGTRCWKAGRYGRGQVMLLAEQALLLVISEKGEALLLAADPKEHRELARFPALSGKTWNHPVIAHGRLFVRNDEEMACYELTMGGTR